MTKTVHVPGPNEKGTFQSNSNACPGHDKRIAKLEERIREELVRQVVVGFQKTHNLTATTEATGVNLRRVKNILRAAGILPQPKKRRFANV